MLVSEAIAPPSPFDMRWKGLELMFFSTGIRSIPIPKKLCGIHAGTISNLFSVYAGIGEGIPACLAACSSFSRTSAGNRIPAV